jgi:transglutaminase-like putative cysteine protease
MIRLDRPAVACASAAAALTFAPAFEPGTLTWQIPVAAAAPALLMPPRTRPASALARGVIAVALLLTGIAIAATRDPTDWRSLGQNLVTGLGRTWRLTLPLPADLSVVPIVLACTATVAGLLLAQRRPGGLEALVPATACGVCGVIAAGTDVATAWQPVLLGALGLATLLVGGTVGARPLTPALTAGATVAVVLVCLPWVARSPGPRVDLRLSVHTPVRVAPSADLLDRVAGWLSQPQIVLFTAHAQPAVARWRLAVLDDFRGDTWASTRQFTPAGLGVPPARTGTPPHATLVRQHIELADLDGPFLPAADRPQRITSAVTAVDTDDGVLISDRPTGQGTSYDVVSSVATKTVPVDAMAAPGPAADLVVPTTLTGDLDRLLDVAKATPDLRPAERAARLAGYLTAQRHNVTGAAATGNVAAIRAFADGAEGTTVQFAATFVLAMRQAGIPARMVVGFLSPHPDAETVRAGEARAWAELNYTGTGWTTYDPTPPAVTSTKPQTLPDVTAVTPPLAQPSLTAEPQTTAAPPEAPGQSLWIWAAALAALIGLYLLAVLTAPALRRTWRRRSAHTPDDHVLSAWHDVLEQLPAGHVLTARLSPAAGRTLIASLTGGDSDANDTLADLADRALYGPEPSTTPEGRHAQVAARELRRRLRRSQPVSRRWRSALSPARVGRFRA